MNELLKRYRVEAQNENSLREVREMIIAPDTLTVFDFDHTMFKTSIFHRMSFQGVLHALGRSLEITPELGAKLKGGGDEEIFEILLDASGGTDKNLLLRAINERKKILIQAVKADGDLAAYFMPGIPDAIRSLRACGKKVGIASASPDGFVQEFVARVSVDGVNINDVFISDAIIGGTTVRSVHNSLSVDSDSPSSLNKPNPFSIRYSANKISGEQGFPILYIGDGRVDALSVRGNQNMVGLIVNAEEHDSLRKEFERDENIIVVGSIGEVLNAK
ncbi:MAG: hypothetical protein ACD_37C00677G0001 [uncultured bacterium]|nr:MAG: hypothetical protein ACD_37C00677G0001 [uncultured bacterium]OGH14751.1 MAG: hypothetical protein A2687_02770 [Candidatus Levybacteria bacterium RIFCSPHIGHO2_01_FULL_38_26]